MYVIWHVSIVHEKNLIVDYSDSRTWVPCNDNSSDLSERGALIETSLFEMSQTKHL